MTEITFRDPGWLDGKAVPKAAPDLPGRRQDVAWLTEQYGQVTDTQRGRTIFLVGDDGDGRTAALRRFAEEAQRAKPRPVVLAGSFRDGHYVPWEKAQTPTHKVMEHLEPVLQVAEAVVPYAALIGEIMDKGKAAAKLVKAAKHELSAVDPTKLLAELLRELSAEKPVVCLIDGAHEHPGAIWGDLAWDLARSIATELPVVLVLATDGPSRLGEPQDDDDERFWLAHKLCSMGIAQWHALGRIDEHELEEWTGPASTGLLKRVVDVTGGRARWTAELWNEWRAEDIVVRSKQGPWTFGKNGRERALDPVDALLRRRVKLLVGNGIRTLSETRDLLVCAALEGQTFTAEAVADALRRDAKTLLNAAPKLDDAKDGLLLGVDGVAVTGPEGRERLSRYRFQAELVWLTLLHHHKLTDAERADLAGALAQALRLRYFNRELRVARAIARLYDIAGDVAAARNFRQMADIGVSATITTWRADAILAGPMPVERADRRRAAQILLAAAEMLMDRGPYDDGLRFAEAAQRLTPLGRDFATALYLTGVHRALIGMREQAQEELTQARELQRELDNRHGVATAQYALAGIEMEQTNYEDAFRQFADALEVFMELGDRHNEANTRHQMASIQMAFGKYDDARRQLTQIMAIHATVGNATGVATAKLLLADLRLRERDIYRARAEVQAALDLFTEMQNPAGAASARRLLAFICVNERDFEGARRELTRALDLLVHIGANEGAQAVRRELEMLAGEVV